jgi:hypothetical protein
LPLDKDRSWKSRYRRCAHALIRPAGSRKSSQCKPTSSLLDAVPQDDHAAVEPSLLEPSSSRSSRTPSGKNRFPPPTIAGQTTIFLLRVDSRPWDTNAARRYADLRAALEIGGIPMGNMEMMIAAHALATEAVLVTNDRSFRRLTDLKIEDWTK